MTQGVLFALMMAILVLSAKSADRVPYVKPILIEFLARIDHFRKFVLRFPGEPLQVISEFLSWFGSHHESQTRSHDAASQ